MPIPFFGLGAARTGTTWLSSLLRSHRDCAVSASGDYHFFDLRYGQCTARQYYLSLAACLQNQAAIAAKKMTSALGDIDDKEPDENDGGEDTSETDPPDVLNEVAWTDEVRESLFRRADFDEALQDISDIVAQLSIADTKSYVSYLARRAEGARAFGEIAPTYALLPSKAFAEIDSLFPRAHFIFFMRDPVDRLWSKICDDAQQAERRSGRPLDLNRKFQRALGSFEIVQHASYQNTICNLERIIPADRILYMFHEDITSPERAPGEIRRIESALELKRVETDGGVCRAPVEPSPTVELDPANALAARKVFSDVYQFVQERFGEQPRWRFRLD